MGKKTSPQTKPNGPRLPAVQRLFAALVVLLDGDLGAAYQSAYQTENDPDALLEHGSRFARHKLIVAEIEHMRRLCKLPLSTTMSFEEMDRAVLEAAYRLAVDSGASGKERVQAVKEYSALRSTLAALSDSRQADTPEEPELQDFFAEMSFAESGC